MFTMVRGVKSSEMQYKEDFYRTLCGRGEPSVLMSASAVTVSSQVHQLITKLGFRRLQMASKSQHNTILLNSFLLRLILHFYFLPSVKMRGFATLQHPAFNNWLISSKNSTCLIKVCAHRTTKVIWFSYLWNASYLSAGM